MDRRARHHRRTWTIAAAVIFVVACGGDEVPIPPVTKGPAPWVNSTPTVHAASPALLAVGEELTVLGTNFIQPAHGKLALKLIGTFFTDDGSQHPVTLHNAANLRSATEARWRLYPNIVFHPQGNRLGKFVGQLHLLNQGNDGSVAASDAYPITITVKPSLIPRRVGPTNASCRSAVVLDTLESQRMSFEVEAVGFRPATIDQPLRFFWTFLGNRWEVNTASELLDTKSLYANKSPVLLIQDVTTGNSSAIEDGGSNHFLVQLAQAVLGREGISTLRTRPLDPGTNSADTTVNVAVVDGSGRSAALSIPLLVHHMADLSYDGNEHLVERYAPQPVTDCIPGGKIGREVSYHETSAESRSLSMGFNYHAELGQNFGLPSNPFALGLNLSMGFGRNVNESISSDQSDTTNIAAQVLPGHFATCYRQTTKIHRIAQIQGWNSCGESVNLGEAVLTDWAFSFDVAVGAHCIPPSSLPPATR